MSLRQAAIVGDQTDHDPGWSNVAQDLDTRERLFFLGGRDAQDCAGASALHLVPEPVLVARRLLKNHSLGLRSIWAEVPRSAAGGNQG